MNLGTKAKELLNVLAALRINFDEEEVDKKKAAAMASISAGSTARNAFAELKKAGCVYYSGKNAVITPQGLDNADMGVVDTIRRPTSNEKKHNSVREGLKPKEKMLFDALIDGRSHPKDELANHLKMDKTRSTWRNLMAALVKPGIAEYPNPKHLRLTKELFPIVPRPEN